MFQCIENSIDGMPRKGKEKGRKVTIVLTQNSSFRTALIFHDKTVNNS